MKHLLIFCLLTAIFTLSYADEPLGPIQYPSGWSVLDYTGTAPLPSRGTSAIAVINSTHAIVHGGVYEAVALTLQGQNKTIYYSDTYLFDVTDPVDAKWTRINSTGPSRRAYSCNFYDPIHRKFYLHGGTAISERNFPYIAFNDTWVFDIATLTWTQLFPSTVPAGRSAMGCDYNQGAGWMFGGTVQDPTQIFLDVNELWKFNISTQNWVLLQNANDSDTSRPDSRDEHFFLTRPGTNKIVLISGQKLRLTILPNPPFFIFSALPITDLWQYDIVTGVWSTLDNSNAPLPHRREAILFLNNRFILRQNGDLPLNDPPTNNTNYKCCGQLFVSVNPTNDAYIYDVVLQKWTEIDWLSSPPKTRRSDAVKMGNYVYLFGGANYLPLQIVDPNSNDPNAGQPVGAFTNSESYKIRVFWPYN